MNLQEDLQRNDWYKRDLLYDLRTDCDNAISCCFIGKGVSCGTVEKQIEYITALWNSLSADFRSHCSFINAEEIKKYEAEMYNFVPYSSETKMNKIIKKISVLTGFKFSKTVYGDSLIYDMNYGCSYITNDGGRRLHFSLVDSEGRCFADFSERDMNTFITKVVDILKSVRR